MELVQDEWDDPTAKIWIGNPTPVVDLMDPKHPGRIWLLFTRSNQQMFVTSSDDNGETWSERREITPTAGKKDWTGTPRGPCTRFNSFAGGMPGSSSLRATTASGRRMRQRRLGFAPRLQRRPRQDLEARRGRHASGRRSAPSQRMRGGRAGGRPGVCECPRSTRFRPANADHCLQQRRRRDVRRAVCRRAADHVARRAELAHPLCGQRPGRRRESISLLRAGAPESPARSHDAHEQRRRQNVEPKDGDPSRPGRVLRLGQAERQ